MMNRFLSWDKLATNCGVDQFLIPGLFLVQIVGYDETSKNKLREYIRNKLGTFKWGVVEQ